MSDYELQRLHREVTFLRRALMDIATSDPGHMGEPVAVLMAERARAALNADRRERDARTE